MNLQLFLNIFIVLIFSSLLLGILWYLLYLKEQLNEFCKILIEIKEENKIANLKNQRLLEIISKKA